MDYRRNEDKWPKIEVLEIKGMEVDVITDLVAEPVSLIEAKDYLHIDTTDDDTVIPALITVARQMMERYSGYSFGQKVLSLYLDEYTSKRLTLPYGPVASVDIVTLDTTDGLVDENYSLSGTKKITLLSGYRNALITYTTKAAVDGWMKSCVLAQVAYLYEHRGDESGSQVCEAARTIAAPFMVLNVF